MADGNPDLDLDFTPPTDVVKIKLDAHSSTDGFDALPQLFDSDGVSTSIEGPLGRVDKTIELDLKRINDTVGAPDWRSPDPNLNADLDFARQFNVEGVEGSEQFIQVEPNQIKSWSDFIDSELVPHFESIKSKLTNQELYVGKLPESTKIEAEVGKLKTHYLQIVDNSIKGLRKLAKDLSTTAREYERTADLSKANAEELRKLIADVASMTSGNTGPTLTEPGDAAPSDGQENPDAAKQNTTSTGENEDTKQ